MKVELLAITPGAERLIEEAGRTCYQSGARITDESAGKFIKMLISRGHLSVLEHASATFRFSEVSRTFSHQIIRHRLLSPSQQSQRYVNESGFDFVIPPSIAENAEASEIFNGAMEQAREAYRKLRTLGILGEDARFVLPNACHTEIVLTGNFREWRHVIEERACNPAAQWEIREAVSYVCQDLHEIAPNCFEDLWERVAKEWEKNVRY
jgi:thymidylate synthase (FAD)